MRIWTEAFYVGQLLCLLKLTRRLSRQRTGAAFASNRAESERESEPRTNDGYFSARECFHTAERETKTPDGLKNANSQEKKQNKKINEQCSLQYHAPNRWRRICANTQIHKLDSYTRFINLIHHHDTHGSFGRRANCLVDCALLMIILADSGGSAILLRSYYE